ncbi:MULTISPECIES: hypothetical protein [unclassified Bacillus (in: firmicutes)]|uniref:hypothetical protein n=1 Tax=unclassified Bacillus (in: firmicutes) TaxID=185979 RepID=UPI0008E14103|nr:MULTISPECIES: hypothetical protein [unclassified Bacillus (in: firmicutes)]SFB09790.1 hypothetical protein SAMN02799634_105294 [Bacillus sp. UNCCL13]SFQ86554.1 hypothetical protein SAMN04488577_2826 [Bacillus sp. cl95]
MLDSYFYKKTSSFILSKSYYCRQCKYVPLKWIIRDEKLLQTYEYQNSNQVGIQPENASKLKYSHETKTRAPANRSFSDLEYGRELIPNTPNHIVEIRKKAVPNDGTAFFLKIIQFGSSDDAEQ